MTDNLARVIPFPSKAAPTKRSGSVKVRTVVPLRGRRPSRRSVNGHTPDCPYPKANAKFCGICASERKAKPDAATRAATLAATKGS